MLARKMALFGLITAVGCSSWFGGQSNTPSSRQIVSPTATGNLPSGTQFWVTLDQPIDPSTAQPGDRFVAHVPHDITSPHGDVLVPAGTFVEGRVAELRPGAGQNNPAAARLVMDSIDMNGLKQPMNAKIVQMQVPSQGPHVKPGYVVGGAGAGALLGGILGGWTGAAIGGLAGAAGGTLISLGTTSGSGEALPPGTQISLQLGTQVRTYATLRSRYY